MDIGSINTDWNLLDFADKVLCQYKGKRVRFLPAGTAKTPEAKSLFPFLPCHRKKVRDDLGPQLLESGKITEKLAYMNCENFNEFINFGFVVDQQLTVIVNSFAMR